jgi:D-alanine transaminase
MSRIAYVNGRYAPMAEAGVHIEDRGYQFADGVYEVIAVHDGAMVDAEPHLARLERSLSELRIPAPMTPAALGHVLNEVISRNRVGNGIIYLQVTRGVARRDHAFPADVRPALVITARNQKSSDEAAAESVDIVTVAENRWSRCDIKSISLLPNVLAKQAAREAGAYEAWFVEADGMVTEGSSTNAWIVDHDGNLVTRDLGHAILPGITRKIVQDLAGELQITVIERAFSVAEALAASEAFITSTTSLVMPVGKIDGKIVGQGGPGPVAMRLRALYAEHMAKFREKRTATS